MASPAGPIRLGGPRQRSVLAMLLLEAGRVVSIERLADELYGGSPPVSAVTQVHRQISELRALLEPGRAPGAGGAVIETRPPGYRVVVRPGALDLHRFERLAAEADASLAGGDPAAAVRGARAALGLWRGEPLADLAFEPFARQAIDRLAGMRTAVAELCLGAEIELGRGPEVVAELEALVAADPLNERLRGLLMVALYRAGRQTDALDRFREGRSALVEAFGLEPTPALRALESRVLAQDPALDAADGRRTGPAPGGPGAVLVAAWDGAALDPLADVGGHLAAHRNREILVTRVVGTEEELPPALAAVRERREALRRGGVTARAAAFASRSPGDDTARMALAGEVDAVVVGTPGGLAGDGPLPAEVVRLLERSPCDVALLAGSAPSAAGGVAVPFGGGDHDWAAAELGAWLAAGAGVPLRLVGARSTPLEARGDASRLLATASIAIERLAGVDVDPVLADPGPEGVVAATAFAGTVLVGLSPRWRYEGLGATRRALVASGTPVLLVHRGPRPGGLAPRDRLTRYTWTLADPG